MKECAKCHKIKDISEFHKSPKSGTIRPRVNPRVRPYCKDCQNEINRFHYGKTLDKQHLRSKNYRKNNKEELRKKSKKWRKELVIETISHYSSGTMKCACCGEPELYFLTIDHINNDGTKQRKELKISGGWRFYYWLKLHGFPDNLGLQVLCADCQLGKERNGGICPHKDVEKSTKI
jgi:hypothetical protein